MNSVKIYVAENQNNTNNLLIDGDSLDLFESETIPYTLKQTDLTDIGSNYAAFTKDFIIPASPKNNRLLKYWLDVKNDNQFQTNSTIPARIDLSGVYFSLGSIKIIKFTSNESGSPKNYTITFTGALSNLKAQFGDLLLSNLPFDSIVGSDVIPFGDADVVSNINSTTLFKSIEIPLISKNRSISDYSTVAYTSGIDNPTGIKRGELRPALSFRTIFDAIELKFGVTFMGDFYTGEILDKLYLWLNKNESLFTSGGNIVRITGTASSTDFIDFVPNTGGSDDSHGYVTLKKGDTTMTHFQLKFNTTSMQNNFTPYRGKIQEVILNIDGTIDETATKEQVNFGIVSTSDFVKGSKNSLVTYKVDYKSSLIPVDTKRHFRFIGEVEDDDAVAIINFTIRVEKYIPFFPPITTTFSPPLATNLINSVLISTNVPELKLQDFLTSIIKMFNLVIIPHKNNTYELDYYNNYYAKGTAIDITKFCNPLINANRVKTYKEIAFKHEDSDYNENKKYKSKQLPIREYGEVKQSYKDGDIDSFKVESKFGLILFRELNGVDYPDEYEYELNNTWIVGDGVGTNNAIVTDKPTIFFYNEKATLLYNKYVAYTTDYSNSVELTTYSQFSNLDDLLSYNTSLCFSSESMFSTNYDNSLYVNNYQRLMSSIASPYAREYEIDAVLPKYIFTTLNLNNQLIIGNEIFSISEISVDLLSGKSKLKLNNIIRS